MSQELRLIRRITLKLIPFLILLYLIAYVDRSAVGFAKLHMGADIGIGDAALFLVFAERWQRNHALAIGLPVEQIILQRQVARIARRAGRCSCRHSSCAACPAPTGWPMVVRSPRGSSPNRPMSSSLSVTPGWHWPPTVSM